MSGAGRQTPLRTCLVCRASRPKADLIRFVFAEEKNRVEDEKKILPGRGYYVCAGECREKWLRRAAKGGKRRGERGGHER